MSDTHRWGPEQALALAFGAGLVVGLGLFALTAWIVWCILQGGIEYWLAVPMIGIALTAPFWIWQIIGSRRTERSRRCSW
jgi:hypothetical protein